MSYAQYPSPGTPPPPYNAGCPVVTHSTGMDFGSPDQLGRNGSPPMSFDLKRSDSQGKIKMEPPTPGSDEQKMTAADKKRNKLGYHRATTACRPPGHKCRTCDKLNKECKFESVSHQGPSTSRHSSISRAPVGARLVSAQTIAGVPGMASGHGVDMHSVHHGGMSMPPIQNMALAEAPELKMGSAALGRPTYPEYNSQSIAANWALPDSATGASRPKSGPWAAYNHDSAAQGIGSNAFSAYSHTTPPPSGAPGWAESATRNEIQWSGYTHQSAQQPFSPVSQMAATPQSAYDRKSTSSTLPAADVYPPLPNMSSDHSVSLSPTGPGPQTAAYGGWPQPGYPPVPGKSGDAYTGGWYSQAEGAGHGVPTAMASALPVSEGYYVQR
ncbi:hypothetical protein BD289DRAFT_486582 [Coniella lustricola]|uniref:Uncharacterized protein n=1 Tax=Coniella lustricola TaxID=2025994 RepID=A0A2T2ZUN5_9PEZI|nr:hypothetical protein BD289DRAFT_486582 [Coniella lustricola]